MRIALLLAVLLTAPAAAQTPEGGWIMGYGTLTCAQWIENEAEGADVQAEQWAVGYLSGRNIEAFRIVGRQAERIGFIAEVRRLCAVEPSQPFVRAVDQAYELLRNRGR